MGLDMKTVWLYVITALTAKHYSQPAWRKEGTPGTRWRKKLLHNSFLLPSYHPLADGLPPPQDTVLPSGSTTKPVAEPRTWASDVCNPNIKKTTSKIIRDMDPVDALPYTQLHVSAVPMPLFFIQVLLLPPGYGMGPFSAPHFPSLCVSISCHQK